MHALQLAGNPLRKMAKLTLPGRKK